MRHSRKLFLSVVLLLFMVRAGAQTVIYVDSSRVSNGTGFTWATAYKYLGDALRYTHNNAGSYQLWVKKGTYFPVDGTGSTSRDSSFRITKNGIKVYGGFNGSEVSVGDRNPAANLTVLSGNVGSPTLDKDNSFHVVTVIDVYNAVAPHNIDASTVIDGFAIREGYAGFVGGTPSFTYQSVTLFTNYGAGIYIYAGLAGEICSPTISNCRFTVNTAEGRGSAVYNDGSGGVSSPSLTNCVFTGNKGSAAVVNLAENGGTSNPFIGNCDFLNNLAGGMTNLGKGSECNPFITGCIFKENLSGQGAAIYGDHKSSGAASGTVVNSLFIGNRASVSGGAIFFDDGNANAPGIKLINCTFFRDTAYTAGSGNLIDYQLDNSGTSPSFANCMIAEVSGDLENTGSSGTLSDIIFLHTLTSSTNLGTNPASMGNIPGANPQFINENNLAGPDGLFRTTDDGLHLFYCSMGIDGGENSSVPAGTSTDIIGEDRTINGLADIGAYENQIAYGMPTDRVSLSGPDASNMQFLSSCDYNGWTYYHNPLAPDSASLAISWGSNNAVAKSAATVFINYDNQAAEQTTSYSGNWGMQRYWNVSLNGATLVDPVKVRFYFDQQDTTTIKDLSSAWSSAHSNSAYSAVKWIKTEGSLYDPQNITATSINGGNFVRLTGVYGVENDVAFVQFDGLTSLGGGTAVVQSPDAAIIIYPVISASVCPGASVGLNSAISVSAAGLTYQWLKNGAAVPGATSANYTLASPVSGDLVRCAIHAGSSFDTSNTITITVNPLPVPVLTGNPCNGDSLKVSSVTKLSQITWSVNGVVLKTTTQAWLPDARTISTTNQLKAPSDVIRSASGDIYVADKTNNRVVKYVHGAGSPVLVAGGNGAGAALNQLSQPSGICFDGSGNLYISDLKNNRVVKWAPGASAGTVVAGGNGQGSTLNKLKNPNAVFVSASGDVYVADGANNRIVKWAPGAVTGTLAAGGNGKGGELYQLDNPADVILSNNGLIYVADFGNNRILRFVPGNFNGFLAAGGNGSGASTNKLTKPASISFSSAGDLIIADQYNDRIVKWTPGALTGTTIAGGAGKGSSGVQLYHPSAACLAGNDTLFVTDMTNNRLQMFEYKAENRLVASVSGLYSVAVISTAGCTGTSNTDTVNASGLAATGTFSTITHGDSKTYNYIGGGCKQMATITDSPNGAVPGLTTVTVTRDATVQVYNAKPYLQRHFQLNPVAGGAGTVSLYVAQTEFTAYNTYVTSHSLGLPLLPTGGSNTAGMANIVITRFGGLPNAATTGPGGQYSGSNKLLIPASAITKVFLGNGMWKLTFTTNNIKGGFFIHSGSVALREGPDQTGLNTGLVMEAWPNPTTGQVHISLSGERTAGRLVLTDITGKQLKDFAIDSDLDIDMSDYTPGLYLLRFSNGKEMQTIKLSRQ
jgi:predicted outer membrane repeat protein